MNDSATEAVTGAGTQEHATTCTLDEEGLQTEYDVVICGTGLVQAILASALARAGRSVLHCDAASVYGELDGAWSLADLMEREQQLQHEHEQQQQLQHEHEKQQQQPRLTHPTDGAGTVAGTSTCTPTATGTATATCTPTATGTATCTPTATNTTTVPATCIPLSPQGGTASLTFHSFRRTRRFGIKVGSRVLTPLGTGTVLQVPSLLPVHVPVPTSTSTCTCTGHPISATATATATLAVALDNRQLAHTNTATNTTNNNNTPISYFGLGNNFDHANDLTDPLVLEDCLHQLHGIRSIQSMQAVKLLKLFEDTTKTRSFVFDISPVVIFAAGRAVDAMLATNVADYLEFKSVEALLWLDGNDNDSDPQPQPLTLAKVPCTKNDVFTTTLLSPMDKRRLMKFLQLAMDFSTQMLAAEAEAEAQQKHDSYTYTYTHTYTNNHCQAIPPDDQVKSLNERHLNQGRSLPRPQNKPVASNELNTLQDWMRKPNVTLEDYLCRHQHLSPKLRSIIRHALALETAEQPASLESSMTRLRCHLQALGRYGTTAFLLPMYGTGELAQAFTRSAAIFGTTYLLRRPPLGILYQNTQTSTTLGIVEGIILEAESDDQIPEPMQNSSRQKKIIRSRQVVLPYNAVIHAKKGPSHRVLRRISVINGNLVHGDQRHVFVLPPHCITGHAHPIHGISMDSSLHVAPPGCTVLHLTTLLTCTTGDNRRQQNTLDKAAQILLRDNYRIAEVYVVNFSFMVESIDDESFPDGVHLCYPCDQSIAADVAFEQAEKIFHAMCPGHKFLGLSDELAAATRARTMQHGQDDERLILTSAMGIIDAQSSKEQ